MKAYNYSVRLQKAILLTILFNILFVLLLLWLAGISLNSVFTTIIFFIFEMIGMSFTFLALNLSSKRDKGYEKIDESDE